MVLGWGLEGRGGLGERKEGRERFESCGIVVENWCEWRLWR